MVQTFHTAEVLDAGFCGDARTSEKYDVVRVVNPLLQRFYRFVHDNIPPIRIPVHE